MLRSNRGVLFGKALLTAALVAFAYLLVSANVLQRVDFLLYDYFLVWQQHRASDGITVVAIDDASLQRLGRWPWSRRIHAEMLDRLTNANARVVGYDVLFPEDESGDPTADLALADALRRNGRTVLAVAPSNPAPGQVITEVLPIPDLAAAAAALGHVDVEIDPDGLSRSFYLHAGLGEPHWPAFALAMRQVDSGTPELAGASPVVAERRLGWARSGRYFVPFDPTPGAIRTVSFQDVLQDDEVATSLAGQYVLVGSTAVGLGDFLASPVSYDHQRMPGVLLNGHILSGVLNGGLSTQITPFAQQTLTLGIVAIATVLMVAVRYSGAFLLFLATVGTVMILTGALLIGLQLWFPPTAAIAPIVLGYLLWGAWSLLTERRLNRSLSGRIAHQALHHATTDLPNQYVLDEHLRALGREGHEYAGLTALMIVHIKWSASAGGIVGRSAGDELLRSIASRLRNVVRGDDLVAHLSSDDFGILVRNLGDADSALRIANDVAGSLREPLHIEAARVFLSPRIGVSLWPKASSDGTALLRDAYIAMFRARIEQTTVPCFYSDDIAREVQARSRLEQALIYAVERQEFEVYYQPQVDAEGSYIVGVEALLRWHNPELGLIFPGTFIPVAEHTGLIRAIGSWVLRTACAQAKEWNDHRQRPLRIAVNLSPLQFTDDAVVGEVRVALEDSGLAPDQLELEITESALMENMALATSSMRLLKDLGVGLAIDDFGTGYSSLSNLQHFPLDRIKIDQSFTREIQSNEDVREITRTIITMAKRLKLDIIAEGVESQWQADFLTRSGCDELQGFFFSHPMPANEISALLQLEAANNDEIRPLAADARHTG